MAKTRGKDKKVRKNSKTKLVDYDVEYWKKQYFYLENIIEKHIEENKLKGKKLENKNIKYHPYEVAMDGLNYFKENIWIGNSLSLSNMAMRMGIPVNYLAQLSGYKKDRKRKNKDFTYILDMFKTFVAMFYEYAGNNKLNPTFPIFLLKNLGLEDRQVVEEDTEDGFSPEERKKVRARLRKMLQEE